jgi:epidermal growth factor receptor substrate 15
LFVALKLVSLAQAGHDVNMRNIFLETNAPRVGDLPKIKPQAAANVDWSIKPNERAKYEGLFDSRKPVNGLIPGNKVKDILMESKLPLETLGRIWDLADQDKDGSLDKHEFTVVREWLFIVLFLSYFENNFRLA